MKTKVEKMNRRKMLARIGFAGAVAYAVPAFTTLSTANAFDVKPSLSFPTDPSFPTPPSKPSVSEPSRPGDGERRGGGPSEERGSSKPSRDRGNGGECEINDNNAGNCES